MKAGKPNKTKSTKATGANVSVSRFPGLYGCGVSRGVFMEGVKMIDKYLVPNKDSLKKIVGLADNLKTLVAIYTGSSLMQSRKVEDETYKVLGEYLREQEVMRDKVSGRIGSGNKMHTLIVRWVHCETKDGPVKLITHVNDICGSARWTYRSKSVLQVIPNEKITCLKCINKGRA
jgi:hypothetical protein